MAHKEIGDKLYLEANYQEALDEYKLMIQEKEFKITPFFNNRLLACARKTKKIENCNYVFELFRNMDPEIYDLKLYNEDQFKLDNATTYLWLIYDLLKEDSFNVNLYLQEVLRFKDFLHEDDKQNCLYYMGKSFFKNEITNKALLKEFVENLDYTRLSKELQIVNNKAIASPYEDTGYRIAKFYSEIGEYEKSNQICDELIKLDMKISKYKTHVLNLQSQNYLQLGEESVAIDKKNQAILARDDWYLYHQKGLIFYNKQEYQSAGKCLTLALIKNNQKLEYLNKLLSDLNLIYEQFQKEDLVKSINSLMFYIRTKNNWQIKPELENAPKIELNDDNYQQVYNDFLDSAIKVMFSHFVVNVKKGVINNIQYDKRFGFIKGDDGKFYHFTTTSILGKQKLAVGDKVLFEIMDKYNFKKEANETTCEYVHKVSGGK